MPKDQFAKWDQKQSRLVNTTKGRIRGMLLDPKYTDEAGQHPVGTGPVHSFAKDSVEMQTELGNSSAVDDVSLSQ